MILEGVVTNVAAFGAFVDIGVHQDGLVHISAMSKTFVKDPREVVKPGDIVKVKVLEVDVARKRIALTMRLDDERRRQIRSTRSQCVRVARPDAVLRAAGEIATGQIAARRRRRLRRGVCSRRGKRPGRQARTALIVTGARGWHCRPRHVSRGPKRQDVTGETMIEAVIWDFGGVLTTSPFEAFARFETERGLPADIIRRTNAANHLENAWAKFERAEIDIDAFDELFAAESLALGAEVRGRDVLPLLSGDLRPEMVEALKRDRRPRFKTGCITNNLPANAIGSHGGRSLYVAEVMALFDHVIESAKIGLRKPDPRIYRMMVETLGVDPKNCVYLDDLGVNLKPAREMGMTTIKVLDATQAIAELEAATKLALRS